MQRPHKFNYTGIIAGIVELRTFPFCNQEILIIGGESHSPNILCADADFLKALTIAYVREKNEETKN